jgi:hypothetical protein
MGYPILGASLAGVWYVAGIYTPKTCHWIIDVRKAIHCHTTDTSLKRRFARIWSAPANPLQTSCTRLQRSVEDSSAELLEP